MALISFGTIVTNIKGKISGSVFSANQAGPTLRNKTMPRRSTTDTRSATNNMWQSFTQYWLKLSQAQRQNWIDFAPNFTFHNKLGVPVAAKGNIVFATCNFFHYTVTGGILINPEVYVGPPLWSLSAGAIDITTSTMKLFFTPANEAMAFFAYATISYRDGKQTIMQTRIKLIGWYGINPFDNEVDLWANYVAKFGVPKAGQIVTISWRRVNLDCWSWSPMQFFSLTVNES